MLYCHDGNKNVSDMVTPNGTVAALLAYDAAGNRLSKTDAGGTVSYTLGVGDRLASWTGGSYSHDTAGDVSVVAVQYVVAALWPFSNFTDLSHFMV